MEPSSAAAPIEEGTLTREAPSGRESTDLVVEAVTASVGITLGSLALQPLELPSLLRLSLLTRRPLSAPRWRSSAETPEISEILETAKPLAAAVLPAPPPTATLGKLYLDQGHTEEAREIFERVLERDPQNAEARAELEGGKENRELEARALLTGFDPSSRGLSSKKSYVLERYLDRLRGRW